MSEAAVAHTVGLGGQALRRSVFEPLPGEGRWNTALLIDGNIGIGGDPDALLRRIAQLLAPGRPVDRRDRPRGRRRAGPGPHRAGTDAQGAAGTPFPWARLGTPRCCGAPARSAGTRSVSGRRTAAASSPCAEPAPNGQHPQRRTAEQRGRDQQPAGQEHIAGRAGGRLVTPLDPPADQREPHQQQQSGQGRRDTDVHQPLPAPDRPERRPDDPVGSRVQRQQHQVVQQRRPDEPQQYAPTSPPRAAARRHTPASANEQARSRSWRGLSPYQRRHRFRTLVIRPCIRTCITGLRTSAGPPTWCSAPRARRGR